MTIPPPQEPRESQALQLAVQQDDMANSPAAAQEFWGYLIMPDKTPAPKLEKLLLGVANYINKQVAPWDVQCLTPIKMVAFYKLVGGNYDSVFLETPSSSLSYIYKSLGCYHSLQPDKDPFVAPSIPSLTPQGFVRWQTVQLLLCPEEHVRFLQEAVKRFEIQNPGEGGPFPKILPAESFPKQPDVEMTQWHESVAEEFRLECEAQQTRKEASTLDDIESVTDSSIDGQSVVDAADYFRAQPRSPRRPYEYANIIPVSPLAHRPDIWQDARTSSYRRRSLGDHDPNRHRDGPTPTNGKHPKLQRIPRQRSPSVDSASSESGAEDDSSSSTSEELPISKPRPREHRIPPSPQEHRRRHSAAHIHEPHSYPRPVIDRRSDTLSPPFFAPQMPVPPRPQPLYVQPLPESFYPVSQRHHDGQGIHWRTVAPKETIISPDSERRRPKETIIGPDSERRRPKETIIGPDSERRRPKETIVRPDGERRRGGSDRRLYGEQMRPRSLEQMAGKGGEKRYPSEERRW